MTGSAAEGTPSPEQLADELRKAKVGDVLVQTSSVLAAFAYGKLAPDVRDLDEAKLAIEALRAWLPLLPEDARRDVRQVVANLQLAFADAVPAAAETPAPAEKP